ncbi:lactoylglutathione lyase [Parasphingorhabdus marina DSM 22363]|uniref:Lactoylglutathione lyase n=1 Tax=Parasphingorhabdus marina DSM 22363 TaxID=1123272 RepID=A0A1N6CXE1_9SPHN|nr:VOC family protein [Parasphingorhabdus marina]SIN63192.1 lactoylglutathione lyase [Parasphingorhabdus marina DSM 22363]
MKMPPFVFLAALAACSPAQETAGPVEADPPEEAVTLGLNHIGFAVSRLDESVAFFVETLGWETAGGEPDYPAVFVTNGEMFVTLWQVTDPANAVAFDRKNNVGLHHMAITVRDLDALNTLHETFVAHEDVTVEFAPEYMGDGPTTHMMIREPSGLRLEFVVPASRITVSQ